MKSQEGENPFSVLHPVIPSHKGGDPLTGCVVTTIHHLSGVARQGSHKGGAGKKEDWGPTELGKTDQ